MTILSAALAAGRREHEAIMLDTVKVHRPGPSVFDQTTGQDTPGEDLVLYTGGARVKSVSRVKSTEVNAGEQELGIRDYEIAVPWEASLPAQEQLRRGDQVLVLTAADPRFAGATLFVSGREYGSTATAFRIFAEDRQV